MNCRTYLHLCGLLWLLCISTPALQAHADVTLATPQHIRSAANDDIPALLRQLDVLHQQNQELAATLWQLQQLFAIVILLLIGGLLIYRRRRQTVDTATSTRSDSQKQRQMEAALKESEARYRDNYNLLQGILESATKVTVFALDREYRYLAFNAAHRKDAKFLWGTDIELGQNWLEGVHTANTEEHRGFCRRGFDRVLAGESFSLESTENVLQPDGTVLVQYFDNFGSPIRNEAGEIIGLTIFSVNITYRKETERKLKETLEFTEGVINAIPDLLFEVDRQGRYLNIWTHTPELLAASKEELLNKTVTEALDAQSAATIIEALCEADENERSLGRVIHLDLPQGERWFELSVSKKPGATSNEVHFLVLSRDVTQLKQTEVAREAALAEARNLAHARSEFLAQMSHELRTPLNGILGFAQLLLHDKRLGGKKQHQINLIRQSGEHLLTLINDILDFIRSDAGRLELYPVAVSSCRLLQTIADIMQVKADKKGVEFVTAFDPNLPATLLVDEKRLRQVLLNLLSNAVKFTETGGRVTLRAKVAAPGRVCFEVEDSGIGIDSNGLETIFQPFKQLGEPHYRFGGTGLGLPISRELVQLMGDDIQVASTPGKGSRFHFEIEAGSEMVPEQNDTARPAVTGYHGERRHLLVVDDLAENRAVATEMLGAFGFQISEACDGEEALQKSVALRPDLILMDVAMPGLDGLEATRRLHQMEGLERLPVIAVSASVSVEDQAACLESGADAFLPKPLNLEHTLEHIGQLLQLEWQYESATTSPATSPSPLEPDRNDLEMLHQLALMGDMRGIVEYTEILVETDPRYRPLCDQLRELASGYQSRAVLTLIRQYRGEGAHESE